MAHLEKQSRDDVTYKHNIHLTFSIFQGRPAIWPSFETAFCHICPCNIFGHDNPVLLKIFAPNYNGHGKFNATYGTKILR